jgi:hypothetical protein
VRAALNGEDTARGTARTIRAPLRGHASAIVVRVFAEVPLCTRGFSSRLTIVRYEAARALLMKNSTPPASIIARGSATISK